MIKNIVFDMGNVLVTYNPELYLNTFAEKEEDKNLLRKEVFHSMEWIKMDKGELTLDQAIASINQRLPEQYYEVVEKLVKNWIDVSEPIPNMEELVLELKENGYNTYVLSNTNLDYHNFKTKIPAVAHMDGEFVSAFCGEIKPHREIYEAFLEKFSLKPEECFFIDDMPINIDGARSVGMKGYVYHGDMVELRKELEANGVKL